MNPSMDHVFQNVSSGFGLLALCVSRSAMWMPLTPSDFISLPQASRLEGTENFLPVSLAMFKIACLTNHDTMPGFAPQQLTAVGALGYCLLSFRTPSRRE